MESNNRIGKRVRDSDNESIIELLEGNYSIIYRIENEDEISVVRIFHGARLLKSLQVTRCSSCPEGATITANKNRSPERLHCPAAK